MRAANSYLSDEWMTSGQQVEEGRQSEQPSLGDRLEERGGIGRGG